MLSKLKDWFRNLVKKIGEANEESLGGKRLDCCDLNTKKNKS